MLTNTVELNWVVGSTAAAGKSSKNLIPFEFGILDADTNSTLSLTSAPPSEFVFAVGSPNLKQATDGQKINRLYNPKNNDVTFRSEKARNVTNLRFISPDVQDLTQVYYLGYNGIDACESINFECGKTYDFHIHAKGRAVRNVFGREFSEVVSVDAPCCDASCGCVDGKVDCSLVIDNLLERFNSDLFWVNRFFKVEKVMSCEPAVTPPGKTAYSEWTLTVCDNGDELALNEVQKQYPTVNVVKKSRRAPYTTYSFTQLTATADPTDFSQTRTTVKGCTTCPNGFTSVAGGFAYVVEIDNTNADTTLSAQLTAVQAVWATATYAEKVNFSYGTSTYYIVTSAAIATGTGDSRIVKTIGATVPTCVQTTPITTAWVERTGLYKITRDLVLTKQNDDCKSDPEELALVTASLAGRTDIVSGSLATSADSTSCIIRFEVSQYNNELLEDGCDVFGSDGAKFDSLPTYQGFRWETVPCEGWDVNENGCPIPPAADTACCQCGLKFTTLSFEEMYGDTVYDINEYEEKDFIDLSVSVYQPDGTPLACPTSNVPLFRKVKGAKLRSLKGRDVLKQILITRFDRQERFMNLTSKEALLYAEREGLKYGVVLNDYYYKIEIVHQINGWEHFSPVGNKEVVSLYIHQDNIVLFQKLRGELIAAFPNAKVEQVL